MPSLTPEVESQLKSLVRSFKLQFDFAIVADMTRGEDVMRFAQINNTTAGEMMSVMQSLGMNSIQPGQSDADILDAIAQFAEDHQSATADDFKDLASKVRAINEDVHKLALEKVKSGQKLNGADMNRIFKKHILK